LFRCNKSEKLRSFGSFVAKSFVFATIFTVATACASSNYMGISLAPGAAPTDVQHLAARAQAGDKQAQLELGERFEEGRGVPTDRGRRAIAGGRCGYIRPPRVSVRGGG
jgi:hypothetical protein